MLQRQRNSLPILLFFFVGASQVEAQPSPVQDVPRPIPPGAQHVIMIDSGDPAVTAELIAGEAGPFYSANDFEHAMPLYKRFGELIEPYLLPDPMRSTPDLAYDALDKKDYFRKYAQFMCNAYMVRKELCERNDCLAAGWQMLEKMKARLVRTQIVGAELARLPEAGQQDVSTLLAREKALYLDPLRAQRTTRTQEEVAALNAVHSRIEKTLPSYHYLGSRVPSAQEVSAILASDEIFLSFFYTDQERTSYVWKLEHGRQPQLLPLTLPYGTKPDSALLIGHTEQARLLLQHGESLDCAKPDLDLLSKILIDSAKLPPTGGRRRLIIATDEDLSVLPFPLLSFNGKPLSESFDITIVPSATIFYHLRTRRLQEGTPAYRIQYVAFASPELPYGTNEVRSVGGLFDAAQKHAPDSATKSSIDQARSAIEGARFLHFISHNRSTGQVQDFYLDFSAKGRDDGRLTSKDIASLSNRAELVLLTACQTAARDDPYAARLVSKLACGAQPAVMGPTACICSIGESFSNLSGSFFAAGSRRLLLTLWDIPDDQATVLLVTHFLNDVRNGIAPERALESAKAEVRRNFPQPAYWAGYVLAGD
jgi:CHAT domain-containing protein